MNNASDSAITQMVMLADEPTASLDTERAFQVVKTFAKLIHEQNRAGIMVTHDLRLCRCVDRVIQMQAGQVVRIGDRRKTQSPRTHFAFGEIHFLPQLLRLTPSPFASAACARSCAPQAPTCSY